MFWFSFFFFYWYCYGIFSANVSSDWWLSPLGWFVYPYVQRSDCCFVTIAATIRSRRRTKLTIPQTATPTTNLCTLQQQWQWHTVIIQREEKKARGGRIVSSINRIVTVTVMMWRCITDKSKQKWSVYFGRRKKLEI